MAEPVIELYPGADENAFASMMVELVRQNLLDHASKRSDFAHMRGRVALVAEDIDSAVSLHFAHGKLRVHRGVHGIPELVLRGTTDALVDLSRMPPDPKLSFLPDFRADATRSVVRAFRERRLQLFGALSHPLLTLRLSRVLSIYA